MNLLIAIQSLLRLGYTVKFQRNGPANNQLTLIKENVQAGCTMPEFHNGEDAILERLALLANDDVFTGTEPPDVELNEPETIDVGMACLSWFGIGLIGGMLAGGALVYSLNLVH